MVIVAVIIIALIIVPSAYYFVYLPTGNHPEVSIQSTLRTSPFVSEYRTQSNLTSPNAITVDASGSVWFILENESKLAELFPSNQTVHEYQMPGASKTAAVTWGMTIESSKNLVWFTEDISNSIWSFNMETHHFTKYLIPMANSFPFGITVDQQGNVWFTELFGNKLGEIAANTNVVSEVKIPITTPYGSEPSGITVDDEDKVWMTVAGVSGIASYYQGNFQFYNLTGLVVSPVGIAADNNGNLWLTQHGPSFISEFNPTMHYFRTISTLVPSLNTSLPYFDYVDSNGNIWFNEHYGNAISVFTPTTETLTEYEIPTRPAFTGGIAGMLTMALSPQNTPWFTELFTGTVGTVDTSKPVGLSLSIQNNTGMFGNPIHLENGSNYSITLSIQSNYTTGVDLKSAVGNFTGSNALAGVSPNSVASGNVSSITNQAASLSFKFSESSGSGNFASTLAIGNHGAAPGVYFVTISAQTESVVVSRIIEIVVS